MCLYTQRDILITYLQGDATSPIHDGQIIIPHICNDKGRWGAGFVLALSKRWAKPEAGYRCLKDYRLGDVQFYTVEKDILVANMIAQHDTKQWRGISPIRYESLAICLHTVNVLAESITGGCSVHMPKIGAGLAGGDWGVIERIINSMVMVPCYVYEYNGG